MSSFDWLNQTGQHFFVLKIYLDPKFTWEWSLTLALVKLVSSLLIEMMGILQMIFVILNFSIMKINKEMSVIFM